MFRTSHPHSRKSDLGLSAFSSFASTPHSTTIQDSAPPSTHCHALPWAVVARATSTWGPRPQRTVEQKHAPRSLGGLYRRRWFNTASHEKNMYGLCGRIYARNLLPKEREKLVFEMKAFLGIQDENWNVEYSKKLGHPSSMRGSISHPTSYT